MELIEVIARTHFSDSRIGSVSRKQRIRIPKDVAEHLISLDLVEYLNPIKAVVESPVKIEATELGGDEPSTLSQPEPVLQEETATLFRRGRRKKTSE